MNEIHVVRQHFDRLPKKHKLLLSGLVLFIVLLSLLPGEADSKDARSQTKVAPGERVSVALPETLADSEANTSLIVTSDMLSKASASNDVIAPPIEEALQNAEDTTEESAIILAQSDSSIEIAESEQAFEPSLSNEQVSVVIDPVVQNLPSGFDDFPSDQPAELLPGQRYALSIDETILSADSAFMEEDQEWQSYTVRSGDNLAKIFSRAGLSAREVHHVSRAGKEARRLLKIRPGESLEILKTPEGRFQELQYSYSPTEAVRVFQHNDKYDSDIQKKELYTRLNYASGEISSNFWNAGVEAGLSDNLIMSLATVFGWDIDFALDIRKGDNFNVIFEENYIEGEFVGYGDIVAAEFSNQGEQFAAIRYKDGNYYTPEGRSMRKSFLRAPVNFKYISSNFNPRRFHPIQKRYKAHNGIDYAAKTGTPVVAAGDGKVIESSYNRFNGHYVFLQHGDTYTTKYIHFSKRAVKKGQWVKQGQVIGYVGATGMAAGPHLHYEFLVNGVHKNPRTVKLPKALPIKQSEKAAFMELARDYKAKLDNNRRIMLAMN